MDLDWKTLVKTIAPTIASVLGTPLAGVGVTALLNVLLPDGQPRPDNPEDFIAKALAGANPELLQRIKDAEQKFRVDMKALDIDLEKFLDTNAEHNTEGARNLKIEWMKTDKWDYEPFLAGSVLCLFAYAEWWVFQYAVAIHTMEPNQAVLIGRVLGTVDAAFMILLNFRWGTSRNAERKTEIDAKSKAMSNESKTVNTGGAP